jgi:hypothetical protein
LYLNDPVVGIDLKNGLIIAPEYSADVEVAAKVDSVSSALWTTGIVDDFSVDEAGVSNFVSNLFKYKFCVGSIKLLWAYFTI